jgi:hypothetical protein
MTATQEDKGKNNQKTSDVEDLQSHMTWKVDCIWKTGLNDSRSCGIIGLSEI